MEQRIGTCGNCGGDVMGYAGPWMGVLPPPPPKCNKCGATPRGYDDVLQMNPPVPGRPATREWTTTAASPVRFDREECTPPHGGKEK